MEELEALDKKALEEQYVRSYDYSNEHRTVACLVALIFLAGFVLGTTVLVLCIIDFFSKG